MRNIILKVPRFIQPKMECAPTALNQIFSYYGLNIELKDLIKRCETKIKYKDWEYKAASVALDEGFKVDIYSTSLELFDPSWFKISRNKLINKLNKRLKFVLKSNKSDWRNGYIKYWHEDAIKETVNFLENGGNIKFDLFNEKMIYNILSRKIPILVCFLDVNLFYCYKRKYNNKYNDIKGMNFGHSVVVSGYKNNKFIITDSGKKCPNKSGIYSVLPDKLLTSILRYDGELVSIHK